MLSRRGIAIFMIVMSLSLVFDQLLDYTCMKKKSWEENKQLPPGPVGIPVLGYYPFLLNDPVKKLSELGKEYGNIFGFNMGPKYTIVLNDWEALKDGLNQSVDRPPTIFSKAPYKIGFAGVNGPEWMETRQLALRLMKETGFYNSEKMQLVQEEARDLVQQITKNEGQPVKIREFIFESTANAMVNLVLGKKLEHGSSVTEGVIKGLDAILKYSPSLAMKYFSPTLAKVLEVIGLEKKYPLAEEAADFVVFAANSVDEIIEKYGTKKEDSFVSRYYKEIKNQKHKTSYITVDSLKGGVLALLAGASEPLCTTLVWALLTMADYPDIQQKVQEELDGVIGKEGSITWADRFKIPYTYATLMESMRYSTLAPILAMREASEDMYIQGYFIPKGTFITANLRAIHNDCKYWKEPDKFNPERFLLDDGITLKSHPESFAPFTYGGRGCAGKPLAKMELLQYFTILMQNFKILPKEGDKVKYSRYLGLTYVATNVELRFIKRQ